MRSTLIRVEQANRRLLAVVTGLVALGATPAASAAPKGVDASADVDLDAMARAALIRAKEDENNGDYLGCVAELAARPDTWSRSSRLGEEVGEAVWRKQRDCTRRARALAEKAVREKDYPAAIELLEPMVEHLEEGNFDNVTVDSAWLISDLAFAYQRNHQYLKCIKVSSHLSIDSAGGIPDRVLNALDHNRAGCYRGLDAEYGIRSGGCRISIDGAIATAVAPPALAPKGAAAACVALVPAKRPPDAPDSDPCPVVALVWKDANAAIQRKVLPVVDPDPMGDYRPDPLNEVDFCHGLSSIARGTMAGKSFIRLRGEPDGHCQGRQCLHIGSIDTFYEWNGHALTPALDVTN